MTFRSIQGNSIQIEDWKLENTPTQILAKTQYYAMARWALSKLDNKQQDEYEEALLIARQMYWAVHNAAKS